MESQAALVGADGAVYLNAIAAVYLHLPMAVDPGNTEKNGPLRFHQALKYFGFAVLGILLNKGPDRSEHFGGGLVKFRFRRVSAFQAINEIGEARAQFFNFCFCGDGFSSGRNLELVFDIPAHLVIPVQVV